MTWTATDRAAYTRNFPRLTLNLGLAIERAGRTWTTWEIEIDDEPTERISPATAHPTPTEEPPPPCTASRP